MGLKAFKSKVLVVILDGYGINPKSKRNAIEAAKKPTLDYLFSNFPFTLIEPGGEKVGLPKGVAGNSEVGHMNLGAGRPIRQDLVRINESVQKGEYKNLEKLNELSEVSKKSTNRIHIMGLLSDGGVHSHINHIIETAIALKEKGNEVFFHAFMDGRDTQRDTGVKYIKQILDTEGINFASMQGRSIGMDRDRRWEKIKVCYDTFIGKGNSTKLSPIDYIQNEYDNEIFDEFITPTLFNDNFAMKKGDSVFFANYRPDRAIQICMALNYPKFKEFEVSFRPHYFLCMTPYIPDEMQLPILFDKEKIKGGISEYLSSIGKKQLKIAETEKYAHVTYFFNGGEKTPFKNEEHVLIDSPKDVQTYDQKPEMSAFEVTDKLISKLDENYDFSVVNFANSDMVGHTGNFNAAIKAIETLDACLEKLLKKCDETDTLVFITADHGNSDEMEYTDGGIHTSHSKALVPFCVYHSSLKGIKLELNGSGHALNDIAPTALYVMGIDYPKEFTGINIFK